MFKVLECGYWRLFLEANGIFRILACLSDILIRVANQVILSLLCCFRSLQVLSNRLFEYTSRRQRVGWCSQEQAAVDRLRQEISECQNAFDFTDPSQRAAFGLLEVTRITWMSGKIFCFRRNDMELMIIWWNLVRRNAFSDCQSPSGAGAEQSEHKRCGTDFITDWPSGSGSFSLRIRFNGK